MDHWRCYLRGCLLELFGYQQQAVAAYMSAEHAEPGFSRPTNRIAYLLASQERFAEAGRYFQAVLRADPGNAVAHFNLGYTHDRRGQYERAIHEFREATRVNRSEEHTSELQSPDHLVCRLLLEKKKQSIFKQTRAPIVVSHAR